MLEAVSHVADVRSKNQWYNTGMMWPSTSWLNIGAFLHPLRSLLALDYMQLECW